MIDWRQQIIKGTVWAGASIVKPTKGANCYMVMRGSDHDWMRYKVECLGGLFSPTALKGSGKSYVARSRSHSIFTAMREVLYDESCKVVKPQALETLADVGLGVWFMDGGGRAGRDRRNAYLNVTKYGYEQSCFIRDYFNSMGLRCSLYQGRKRLRIYFGVRSTVDFFSVFAHCLPVECYHRIDLTQ